MPRYVAFLRGINVGGHRVAMHRLTELLAGLGLSEVSTLLASGNVMFRSKSVNTVRLTRSIETCLQSALGYAVPTILRTHVELTELLERNPFPGVGEQSRPGEVYVLLLPEEAKAGAQSRLDSAATADDDFRVLARDVFWLRRRPISESRIPVGVFQQALGHPGTSRNLNTLVKLRDRLGKSDIRR